MNVVAGICTNSQEHDTVLSFSPFKYITSLTFSVVYFLILFHCNANIKGEARTLKHKAIQLRWHVVLLKDVNGRSVGFIFMFPVVLLVPTAGYSKPAPHACMSPLRL